VLAAIATEALAEAPRATASSETDTVPTELWANVTLDFPKGERWLFEADFEPKTLVSGGEKWWNLDFTPLVEYYPTRWLDAVAETTVGYTHQADDVNSAELTPRIGIRLNVANNLREHAPFAIKPLGRIRVATLIRVEYRSFWYNDDEPAQHEWRLRARLEAKVGINRADFSQDRSLYAMSDVEWFAPLTGDVSERFPSKARVRFGLGYRLTYANRFEVIYIRNWHRDTKGGQKEPASNALDARLKLFF
jgi:hypothetical protein